MTADIRYTESILRSAIIAYTKRVYLKNLLGPTLAAILLLAAASFSDSPWIWAFGVVVIIFLPSVIILGYWMRIRHSLKILDMLEGGKVEITVSDDGVTTTSAIGHSHLKWSMFSDLWETPDSKLLIYTNNHFITLPKSQISEDFFEVISQRLKKQK